MKPLKDNFGYVAVSLHKGNRESRKRFKIHHLVCEHFIGKRPDNLIVNHKNGNKSDNRLSNLEYVTYKENSRHALKIGLHLIGEKAPLAKLKNKEVVFIKRNKNKIPQLQLAKMFNVSRWCIRQIHDGINWKHIVV